METAQLVVAVLGFGGALVGIWFGAIQVRLSRVATEAEFIVYLDEWFKDYSDVRELLRPAAHGRGVADRPTRRIGCALKAIWGASNE